MGPRLETRITICWRGLVTDPSATSHKFCLGCPKNERIRCMMESDQRLRRKGLDCRDSVPLEGQKGKGELFELDL